MLSSHWRRQSAFAQLKAFGSSQPPHHHLGHHPRARLSVLLLAYLNCQARAAHTGPAYDCGRDKRYDRRKHKRQRYQKNGSHSQASQPAEVNTWDLLLCFAPLHSPPIRLDSTNNCVNWLAQTLKDENSNLPGQKK
ncbi:unnamed protein product [Protopolystoma xenopodis]|uniref:Uncharacterized protein n=1 Tax=Protopolystoma xenopodis TaxID=117903 RepID=A0A3S5FFU1_9PLAT|nr:unnamed protein product [Protopolystoma xenopodis]